MDYAKLRTEITTDPAALGYAALGTNDSAIAAKLNATDTGRTMPRTAVPIAEFFNQIDDGAWPSTAILQNKLSGLLTMQTIDASNTNVRGIIGTIFPNSGATAATRTRLLALQNQAVSRAIELGLGAVTEGDCNLARTKAGGW